MTLTKDDLKAIGSVVDERVSVLIDKRVRPIVNEEIRTAITEQNKMIAHGFADLKAVMEHTYVNREEFEQVRDELQNEVDDLRKELQKLKNQIAAT